MGTEAKRERTAIVTGATGAIGRAIAEGLARAGFELLLPVRDRRRAAGLPGRLVEVDLSRKDEIDDLARGFAGPLDALVANAAECPRRREETTEGIERQLATNVLGYFWLAVAFEGALVAAAPSRVALVASYWAGGLDVDDLEFRRRPYDPDAAYRQAKQANRMTAAYLAERMAPFRVWVASCHPGDVTSKLSRSLGFGGSDTPAEAADTPVWMITSSTPGPDGAYYVRRRPEPCPFCRDGAAVAALMARLGAY